MMNSLTMTNGYTPTQQAMLDVLSDGQAHTRQELHACLPDELGPLSNINSHLCNTRKHLRPIGQDIVCELVNRRICYRHVRLLASTYTGK
jgi:hypothetical protein